MIGLAFTHATPRVKSPGSNRAFFGNNPVCMVAPMQGEAPFCFDAATSSITFNAVKATAAAGQRLSAGLVADAQGHETTDPSKAEQLMPIGDYKGFGLSMMVWTSSAPCSLACQLATRSARCSGATCPENASLASSFAP